MSVYLTISVEFISFINIVQLSRKEKMEYLQAFVLLKYVYFIRTCVNGWFFCNDFSCKHPMTFGMWFIMDFKPYFICAFHWQRSNFHVSFSFPVFVFIQHFQYNSLAQYPICQYHMVVVCFYLCARETPSKLPKHAHILFRST